MVCIASRVHVVETNAATGIALDTKMEVSPVEAIGSQEAESQAFDFVNFKSALSKNFTYTQFEEMWRDVDVVHVVCACTLVCDAGRLAGVWHMM